MIIIADLQYQIRNNIWHIEPVMRSYRKYLDIKIKKIIKKLY